MWVLSETVYIISILWTFPSDSVRTGDEVRDHAVTRTRRALASRALQTHPRPEELIGGRVRRHNRS